MNIPIVNKERQSKEGAALLVVILVTLVFSILSIGLFKLSETSAVEAVKVEHYKQAFWLAEAGLADGMTLLKHYPEFRADPSGYTVPTKTVAEVGGTYDLTVEKEVINTSTEQYAYTITSVGRVNGITRRLQTVVSSYPGSNNIIIGINGNTDLAANIDVVGSIAQIEGTLTMKDSRYMDGYFIMGDGEDALTDKKGEAIVANYPPPPVPAIKYDDYDGVITKLANNTNFPHKTSVVTTESVLSGTLYFNADEVIVAGTGTTIADGTTIVTTGSISFPKSHVTIGRNVTIVAADFSMANQSDIGGGSLIYSQKNIYLANASDSSASGQPGVTLLARGDITLASQIDFRGIMFAEGTVNLDANGSIEGSIIGGIGINADANMSLTYDPTVYTAGTPIDPIALGDVILTQTTWREIPL